MQATTPQACNQFLAHKSAASYPKRHLYTGFACGIADPDWEFIDREYSNSCHETGAALAYKFASEENPMQLRNDTGGMDDDEFNDEDEGVDVVYPYQQYMNKAATVASEEEMSDVPECELSSSHEGSVIDDDVLDRMDAVANSGFGTGAFSHGPVVFRPDGDEVMEIEMGMQMDDISVDSSKKRKRWADDDDNAQQQIQQLQYPTQTKFSGAPWGALQQNNAKRVRVVYN